MFEGYILSLKGHFNKEIGVMRTELQSTTTSIRQLETSVTNELDNIKKLIKGAGYTEDYQNFGGSSPFRTNSPTSRPDHQIPPAFVSTEKVKVRI